MGLAGQATQSNLPCISVCTLLARSVSTTLGDESNGFLHSMGWDRRWIRFMDPAAIEAADALDVPAFTEKRVNHGFEFLNIEHAKVF
jgi:hypothetical protein